MPSSAFGSSPISAIRRTVSRELKPASTKTRVPLATKSTAFPVEPLPSTVSFIGELHHKDTKNTKKKLNQERRTEESLRHRKHNFLSFLFFVFFVSSWLINSLDFQPRTIDGEPVQVTQRAQRQRRRGKAFPGDALDVFPGNCFNAFDDFFR